MDEIRGGVSWLWLHGRRVEELHGVAVPEGKVVCGREWGQSIFTWYNQQHYHSALGLLTPASVHYGQADLIVVQRQQVLQAVYTLNPERFVKGQPVAPLPPQEVWINPPKPDIILLH